MDRRIDGWMDRRLDGDGWMDGWMDGWVDGRVDGDDVDTAQYRSRMDRASYLWAVWSQHRR